MALTCIQLSIRLCILRHRCDTVDAYGGQGQDVELMSMEMNGVARNINIQRCQDHLNHLKNAITRTVMSIARARARVCACSLVSECACIYISLLWLIRPLFGGFP